jgi:hypothetical protein
MRLMKCSGVQRKATSSRALCCALFVPHCLILESDSAPPIVWARRPWEMEFDISGTGEAFSLPSPREHESCGPHMSASLVVKSASLSDAAKGQAFCLGSKGFL